jgi:hypothetical protein
MWKELSRFAPYVPATRATADAFLSKPPKKLTTLRAALLFDDFINLQ